MIAKPQMSKIAATDEAERSHLPSEILPGHADEHIESRHEDEGVQNEPNSRDFELGHDFRFREDGIERQIKEQEAKSHPNRQREHEPMVECDF